MIFYSISQGATHTRPQESQRQQKRDVRPFSADQEAYKTAIAEIPVSPIKSCPLPGFCDIKVR